LLQGLEAKCVQHFESLLHTSWLSGFDQKFTIFFIEAIAHTVSTVTDSAEISQDRGIIGWFHRSAMIRDEPVLMLFGMTGLTGLISYVGSFSHPHIGKVLLCLFWLALFKDQDAQRDGDKKEKGK
jgi:hypothetical protein